MNAVVVLGAVAAVACFVSAIACFSYAHRIMRGPFYGRD